MNNSLFEIPILFIIFRRPEQTKRVFERIRAIRPEKLYVGADGPRTEEEVKVCEETRKIIEGVDWPCDVKKLYQTTNQTLKYGPYKAIEWFFSHEEMGIIIEDDCLPANDFFTFCKEMLIKYKKDERVMLVTGHNVIETWDKGYSYHFSKIGSIWGWASWRRAWKKCDIEIKLWERAKAEKWLKSVYTDEKMEVQRSENLELVYTNKLITWDYQWTFARLINSGLSIVPKKNLISNIGFGENSTNTFDSKNKLSEQKSFQMNEPLFHPPFMVADSNFDRTVFYTHFYYPKKRTILVRVKNKINSLLKHI